LGVHREFLLTLRRHLVRTDSQILRRGRELEISLEIIGHRGACTRLALASEGGNGGWEQSPLNDPTHVSSFGRKSRARPRVTGEACTEHAMDQLLTSNLDH